MNFIIFALVPVICAFWKNQKKKQLISSLKQAKKELYREAGKKSEGVKTEEGFVFQQVSETSSPPCLFHPCCCEPSGGKRSLIFFSQEVSKGKARR
jgi:hypothetical protein